jgi:hypothetical protein
VLVAVRRALSPDFSAGALALFIPWRVGAEESGAAKEALAARCLLDLLGSPGRRSGCWPHDGEVAGGAVADSTLVISGSGRWPRRSQDGVSFATTRSQQLAEGIFATAQGLELCNSYAA